MAMLEDITGGLVFMDWGITECLITTAENIMLVMAWKNLVKCFTMEIIIFNFSSTDTMEVTIMVEDITSNMVTVEEAIFMTVDIIGSMGTVMVLMDGCITECLHMVDGITVGMVTVMAEDIIHIDMHCHGGGH